LRGARVHIDIEVYLPPFVAAGEGRLNLLRSYNLERESILCTVDYPTFKLIKHFLRCEASWRVKSMTI
jgi:hypothetical protein